MNRNRIMQQYFFFCRSLIVLLLGIVTAGVAYGQELFREISSFPPLKKNEKFVYFEKRSDKSTSKVVYFAGQVYRNKKGEDTLLYSNDRAEHWGPFFISTDKKVIFIRTEDVEDPDFPSLVLYGLFMIDGKRGKVYEIANTDVYAKVSGDGNYTIYNDSRYYAEHRSDNTISGQISHIVVISNIQLKKVYEVTIPGNMEYHRGKSYFIWDQASKTFQFMIIAQDGYWEEYKINVVKKTTERIFRSTEVYIGE